MSSLRNAAFQKWRITKILASSKLMENKFSLRQTLNLRRVANWVASTITRWLRSPATTPGTHQPFSLSSAKAKRPQSWSENPTRESTCHLSKSQLSGSRLFSTKTTPTMFSSWSTKANSIRVLPKGGLLTAARSARATGHTMAGQLQPTKNLKASEPSCSKEPSWLAPASHWGSTSTTTRHTAWS